MKDNVDKSKGCCSSIIDPITSPATAAVEMLKYYPEMEFTFKHIQLLSEGDEAYFHLIAEDDDSDVNDQPNTQYNYGHFDMRPLSQISESISRECGQSIITSTNGCGTLVSSSAQLSSNIKKSLDPNRSTGTGQDNFSKKQRRLVACNAWDSQLAEIDSSPSVTVHERGCSARSHFSSKRF